MCLPIHIQISALELLARPAQNLELEISKSTCGVGGNVDAVGAERVCKYRREC